MNRRLSTMAVLLAAAVPIAPAHAAEATMPLGEVRVGAVCQAASVIRGEEISTFGAEVLDVIPGAQPELSRILLRVSGPAVDDTGVGPGFSGSPIRCPRADGSLAIAGAISEAVGDYGGKVVLATPIEPILAEPIEPVLVRPRAAAAARTRGARPLAGVLTLSGAHPQTARALSRAAQRAGRVLITTPAGLRQAPASPTPPQPGSAVFAGYSSGQIGLGALGTVAYVDGPRVWAFGHPLDGAGRRSLFLQAARVSTVIFNPIGTPDLITYKLGGPAGTLGTLSGDGISAITGTVGAPPPSYPIRVLAQDRQTGREQTITARVADEAAVGLPGGESAFGIVTTAAAGTLAQTVLRGGTPSRASGEMCLRLQIRQHSRQLRFCNRYVLGAGAAPLGIAGPVIGDLEAVAGLLDAYEFGPLEPTDVQIALRLRRGTTQAFVVSVKAPRVVRRGQTVTLRLRLRRVSSGRITTQRIRARVPASAPRGTRMLTVAGPPADSAEPFDDGEGDLDGLFGGGAETDGPTTPKAFAREFEDLGRYDGLRLSFPSERQVDSEEGDEPQGTRMFRDPQLRLSGTARTEITIR